MHNRSQGNVFSKNVKKSEDENEKYHHLHQLLKSKEIDKDEKDKQVYFRLLAGLKPFAETKSLTSHQLISRFRILFYECLYFEKERRCSDFGLKKFSPYRCVCGRRNLKHIYHMENMFNGKRFVVGKLNFKESKILAQF